IKLVILIERDVEVTISLYNPTNRGDYHTSEKVITLKDLSEFQQKSYIEAEATSTHIENEIVQRQNELELLAEKKQKMIQDIQTAIEKEKEAWLVTKEEERQ